MGRRPRFSRSEVENAAIAVLDRDGPSGLTIRAVAQELGTGPMTLYTYVDDRAGLDALAVDGVMRTVTVPAAPSDWRSDVMAIAESVWQAVRPHPHAIPLILARRSTSASFLNTAEVLLAALARSGLTGPDLLAAFRAVTTLATSFAMTELAGPLAADREASSEVVDRFRSLPRHDYPHLVEIAGAAASSTPEAELRSGLTALLDGLVPNPPDR